MRNIKRNSFTGLIMVLISACIAASGTSVIAQTQTSRATASRISADQPPVFAEYKGVRLGRTAAEARATLGEPRFKADDQDFYAFSESETAQICYDSALRVRTISIDYLGGIGAPDYRSVVGADIDTRVDGSLYKLVRYDKLGYWVSYHRTAGQVSTVTVTIQKI